MSEFKGTPGPWEMKKEKGEPEWFVFQKGSMKKIYGGTIRTPVAEEINNKHDAKLISAAPELLEALQKMIGCIEYYASLKESDQPNIEDWAYANNSAEVEMSRAAIAKALGK